MARDPIANDNNENAEGYTDDDASWACDNVLELLLELQENGISHQSIIMGVADALVEFVPGDVNCDAAGEGELWSGIMDLHIAENMLKDSRRARERRQRKIADARNARELAAEAAELAEDSMLM